MREKKVHVNDRLSPNSLILVRKIPGDEVVFLRVAVFVLDGTLHNLFGHAFYYRTSTKNPGTLLRIKMSRL